MLLPKLAPPWLIFSCCLAVKTPFSLFGMKPSPGQSVQHNLDSIIPATDPSSGRVKCCPAGTDFDGKACVVSGPTCPPGTYRKGKHCLNSTPPQCGNGYEYNDGQCVSRKPPACDQGTVLVKGQCVHERQPACAEGFQLRGAVCESFRRPQCPEGDVVHGSSCVTPEGPYCPDGSKVEGASCIFKTAPQCPAGTRYVSSTRQCISEDSPKCPDGTTLEFGQCTSSQGPKLREQLDAVQREQLFQARLVKSHRTRTIALLARHSRTESASSTPTLDLLVRAARRSRQISADGQCVTTVQATCTLPAVHRGGRCVHGQPTCQAGFILTDDGCRSIDGPGCPSGKTLVKGTCVSAEKESCKPGYTLKDGQCVSSTPPSCGDNQFFNGTSCVGVMPDCPENTYFESGQCVSTNDPKCEANFAFNGKSCVAVKEPSCPDGHSYNAATGECFDKVQPECQDGEIFEGGQCKLVTAPCVEYKFCSTEVQGSSGSGSEPKPAGGSGDKSQSPPSEEKPAGYDDFIKKSPDDTQPPEPLRDGPSDGDVAKPTGEDQLKDGSQQVIEQPSSENAKLNGKEPPKVLDGDNTGFGDTGKVPNVPPQAADPVRPLGGDGRDGYAGSGKGGASMEYDGSAQGGSSEEEAARKKGGRWVEYDEELPRTRKLGRRWIDDDDDAAGGDLTTDQKVSGNISGGGDSGNIQGGVGLDGKVGQDGTAWGGGNMGAGGRREWSWTSQGRGADPSSGGSWNFGADTGELNGGLGLKFSGRGGPPGQQEGTQIPDGGANGDSHLSKFLNGDHDHILDGLRGSGKGSEGIQRPTGEAGSSSRVQWGDGGFIKGGFGGGRPEGGSENMQRPTGDASEDSHLSRLLRGDHGYLRNGAEGSGNSPEGGQKSVGDEDSHYMRLMRDASGHFSADTHGGDASEDFQYMKLMRGRGL